MVEAVTEFERVGRCGVEGQGPFYVVNLKLAEGRIVSATCRSIGCVWSDKIGAVLAAAVTGKTPYEACFVTEAVLESELGDVPRSKKHFLLLAVRALRSAL
jgi:hypothetical protein